MPGLSMSALWSAAMLFASAETSVLGWIADSIENSSGELTTVYGVGFGTSLTVPSYELALNAEGVSRLDIAAETHGADIAIRFSGDGWLQKTEKGVRLIQQNNAHELAHVWHLARFDAEWEPRWLHEGFAELLSSWALVESGLWTEVERNVWRAETDRACARALAQGPLIRSLEAGTRDASYACGYVMLDAIADRMGMTPPELFNAYAETMTDPVALMGFVDGIRIDTRSALRSFIYDNYSRADGLGVIASLRAGRL